MKASELLRQNSVVQNRGSYYSTRRKAYCALGKIAMKRGWKPEWYYPLCASLNWQSPSIKGFLSDLPEKVRDDVVEWNDTYKLSFEEIASRLEELGY